MSHVATNADGETLRVFLFGMRGYMSTVLERLLADERVRVVGLCSGPPAGFLRRARAAAGLVQRRLRIRGRYDVVVRDPFAACADPWRLAQRNGVTCYPDRQVKDPAFAEKVRAVRPDLLLVAGFPRLIPPSVIATPSQLGINLHPSLLPRHRGGTPNRWIIRNGETETGITAHVLDENFDTGEILGQWPVTLEPGMDWGEAEHQILANLPGVVEEIVTNVVRGALVRTPQPQSSGEYEPPFHGEHAWIDWSRPVDEIAQTCLATRPKTGALTSIDGRRQCIWSVSAVTDQGAGSVAPGTILHLDADSRPVVACGSGQALVIERIVAYGEVRDSRGWRDFGAGYCFQTAFEVSA
jgi:methionyl-tRNA formyltransferase